MIQPRRQPLDDNRVFERLMTARSGSCEEHERQAERQGAVANRLQAAAARPDSNAAVWRSERLQPGSAERLRSR
jgi:formiminotetrahydrofolate cyclodeaminase